MMRSSRMTSLLLTTLLSIGSCALGCAPQAAPDEQAKIQQDTALNTKPLGDKDMKSFEVELLRQLNVPAEAQKQFRILEKTDADNGSFILYALPNHDGLAYAGRRTGGEVVLYEKHWPLAVSDPAKDLVVVRAIPPNNPVKPKYGVLAGRVYSPFIENIEVRYRDGQTDRVDVSHTRGFILVRKAFDPRFVQVRGFGMNGTPYWNIDTR
jgi:hypothetical protein